MYFSTISFGIIAHAHNTRWSASTIRSWLGQVNILHMYIFNEIHSDLNTDICPVKSFISESKYVCTRSNCVRFIALHVPSAKHNKKTSVWHEIFSDNRVRLTFSNELLNFVFVLWLTLRNRLSNKVCKENSNQFKWVNLCNFHLFPECLIFQWISTMYPYLHF